MRHKLVSAVVLGMTASVLAAVGLPPASAVTEPSGNLTKYWSFEGGSDFTKLTGANTLSRIAPPTGSTAYHGSKVLKVVAGNTSPNQIAAQVAVGKAVAGTTYTASIALRNGGNGGSGRSGQVFLQEVSSTGAVLKTGAARSVVFDGTWTVNAPATIVAGTNGSTIRMVVKDPVGAGAQGASYWADAASVVPTAPAPPAPQLKPAVKGLAVVVKPYDPDAKPGQDLMFHLKDMAGELKGSDTAQFATIQVGWTDIDKGTSGPSYNWTDIDKILTDYPGVRFRLRILAGRNSPVRLMGSCGGSGENDAIDTNGYTSDSGGGGCVPRFWTPTFLAAYDNLMATVASRYEANPQVVEVVNSACSTAFAEPFILGLNDTANTKRAEFYNAGLTKGAWEECISNSSAVMAKRFKTTRFSVAAHQQWEYTNATGAYAPEGNGTAWAEEQRVINSLRASYGQQLVLDEHGLKKPHEVACTEVVNCYLDSLPDVSSADSPSTKFGFQFQKGFYPKTDARYPQERADAMAAAKAAADWGACNIELYGFDWVPDENGDGDNHDDIVALQKRFAWNAHCQAA